jgi:hypothetical protein
MDHQMAEASTPSRSLMVMSALAVKLALERSIPSESFHRTSLALGASRVSRAADRNGAKLQLSFRRESGLR